MRKARDTGEGHSVQPAAGISGLCLYHMVSGPSQDLVLLHTVHLAHQCPFSLPPSSRLSLAPSKLCSCHPHCLLPLLSILLVPGPPLQHSRSNILLQTPPRVQWELSASCWGPQIFSFCCMLAALLGALCEVRVLLLSAWATIFDKQLKEPGRDHGVFFSSLLTVLGD
jgi:hypothetical protein